MKFEKSSSVKLDGRQIPAVKKIMTGTVFIFVFLLSVCGGAWSEEGLFFQDVNPDQLETALIHADVVRRIHPVLPDLQSLTILDQGELVLNLFDDVLLKVSIARQAHKIVGQTLWEGTVMGVAHSYVLLVSDGENLSGEISGAGFHYQIRPWEDEIHLVREMVEEQLFSGVSKVSGDTALEAEVIVQTNKERAAFSLQPYSYDANLTTSARGHATDMAVQDYFAHNSLDGRTPFQRITAAGYSYNTAGENIAAGQTTAIQVVTAWMNSTTGHREAILSPTFCDIGVGYAYEVTSTYGSYWAQNFGRKAGLTVCPAPSNPAPAVTTGSATGVRDSAATLNGSVNPNGLATNYLFQYGLTTSYGLTTTINSAGSGTTAVAVSAPISGLKASTLYHYRLVATSASGTSYGSDKTLTTSSGSAGSSIPVGVLSLILSDAGPIIFSEKFDQNPSDWTIHGGGLWQWGQPNCGATSGHTGVNAYSYNLTGNYEGSLGLLEGPYIRTPSINCSGRNNVHLKFWRWLEVEGNSWDHASISVSSDGTNWTQIWANPNSTLRDLKWEEVEYDISAWADNQSTVYIRWMMGPTDNILEYCGWNIDDVEVYTK
jgi:uncharacterized protein YkwD